jgi:hypothetical protein
MAKFIDDHWKVGGVIVLLAAAALEVRSPAIGIVY